MGAAEVIVLQGKSAAGRTEKTFTLPDEKRANTFLYPYGYLASRKEGICSMDGTVTPDIPESKKKFLMESDSRGRELSEQQHGETKPDTGDENTAFAEDEGKGFLCCAASYMIIICIL